MPAEIGYFHNQPSYFYIFSLTEFYGYRIFLLLFGKQCGHSYRISHRALFSKHLNCLWCPNIVRDIINKFTPVNEPKRTKLSNEDTDAVNLDDDGNVEIPNEIIVGKSQDIFGTKHYEDIAVSDTQTIFNQIKEPETIIDKSRILFVDL